MRPMRGSGGRLGFTGLKSMSAKLALGLVAGSVLYLLTKETLGRRMLLTLDAPGKFLWQPFTYAFIAANPLGIIAGALIIWTVGSWLEGVWGSRRLLWVAVGCTALAGLLTSLLALVLTLQPLKYEGGMVMTIILWVGYGLTIGRGQTNFWGMPLSGNAFAGIGAGVVALSILTNGTGRLDSLQGQIPDMFGLAIIFAYVHRASLQRLWLYFQYWRLQGQFRGRSRNRRGDSSDRRYMN